jgi:hypothetical protein
VNISAFEEVLDKGESIDTEFRLWVKESRIRELLEGKHG